MAGTRTGVSFSQVLGGRDQDRCQFQTGVGWQRHTLCHSDVGLEDLAHTWQRPGQVSVSGRCWVRIAKTRTDVRIRQVLGGKDLDMCWLQAGVLRVFRTGGEGQDRCW